MTFKIHYKEKLYFGLMALISSFIYGFIFLYSETVLQGPNGKMIVGLLLFFIILNLFGSLLFVGHLRGNAIKINKSQFPDVYEVLELHAKKLEFEDVPNMYLLQGNGILNAFATRFAKRDYVILHSNILELAYQEGMDSVSFIIGHELGHIKRSHVGFFKSLLIMPARLFVPFLGNAYSRACEYTCDNIGYNLCPQGALKGILILASGKKLYKMINVNDLLLNAKHEPKFAMTFAEVFSTHPALVKRIDTINNLNLDNLTSDYSVISPKVDIKQVDIN